MIFYGQNKIVRSKQSDQSLKTIKRKASEPKGELRE